MKYIFLGGAPKCGTSALFEMLGQIPSIASSIPKETYFFLDEDYPLSKKNNYHTLGLKAFDRFFKDKKKNYRLEASTHLIYQKRAPSILKDLDSYFIFILREPAAKLRSSFEYTINNLSNIKGNLTFSEYVNIILNNSIELKKYERQPGCLEILKRGLYNSDYPSFIKHWKSAIPEERIIVIDYEFFKIHPQLTVDYICKRVGIEKYKIINKEKNATIKIKNKKIHSFARRINQITPNIILSPFKNIYFNLQSKNKIFRSKEDEEAFELIKSRFKFDYLDLCDISFKNQL